MASLNSEGLNLEIRNPFRICLKIEEKQENLCRDGRSQDLPGTYWLENNSVLTKTPKAPDIFVNCVPLLCWLLQVYLRKSALKVWIACQYNCTLLVIWFSCVPVVFQCPDRHQHTVYAFRWSGSGISSMPLVCMSPKRHVLSNLNGLLKPSFHLEIQMFSSCCTVKHNLFP